MSHHEQNRNREPKGRPTGGQFAEEPKSPSGITLNQEAGKEWDNTIPRELADALADRGENDDVVRWLHENEYDDRLWDRIGGLLDDIEAMARADMQEQ